MEGRKRQRKHTVDRSRLSSRCQVQRCTFNSKLLIRELGNVGIHGKPGSELERDPQPELDLPWRAERIDARADPDSIYIVPSGSGSIDLACTSRQQSVER